MKKKLISTTYLKEATKYQMKFYLDEEDYYISVKKLIHITDKFITRYGIVAMDDGYYVIEIIPKTGHQAIRIFLDESKNLIEYYFDIIKESGLDAETKIPYFLDLYLDITVLSNGETHVIDEDEFERAYKIGDITKEEYDLVLKEKDKLLTEIKNNTNKLVHIDYHKKKKKNYL